MPPGSLGAAFAAPTRSPTAFAITGLPPSGRQRRVLSHLDQCDRLLVTGAASVPPAPSASARETLDASVARLSGLNTDQLRLQFDETSWAELLPPIFPDGCSCACSPIGSKPRHSGISTGRFCDVCTSARDEAQDRGTLVLQPADRRHARASGSNPELCWSANGTAVSSGS